MLCIRNELVEANIVGNYTIIMPNRLKIVLILFTMTVLFSGLILVEDVKDVEGLKASKTKSWNYGAKTKGIVCGDKLCSEKYKSR